MPDFIPLERIKELSNEELNMLRKYNFTFGYFDVGTNTFVVRRPMGGG